MVRTLSALRAAEESCRRCSLYKDATQAVPGVGPRRAFRCASSSERLRSATDCVRRCGRAVAPIISICCPAITEVAIVNLSLLLLLPSSQTKPGRDRYLEEGTFCYWLSFA